MKKLFSLILKPFRTNLPLFLALWILASSADVFYWLAHDYPAIALFRAMFGFLQCYGIVFVCGLFKGRFLKTIQILLLIFGFINMMGDTCVHAILHEDFSEEIIPMLTGTNPNESAEFIPTYVTWRMVIFVVITSLIVFAILYFTPRIRRTPKWLSYGLTGLVPVCIVILAVAKSSDWDGIYLDKARMFAMHEPITDLSGKDLPDPDVSVDEAARPGNIVLIIGESLSRRHCSLYGYAKPTTPVMDSLFRDGRLIRFTNATAAYVSTVEVFKQLMTTYHRGYEGKWYSYPNLINIMQKSGYRTNWISNQSNVGYENLVAAIGNLSDTTIWAGAQGLSMTAEPDECVIPHVESILSQSAPNNFTVVHLMGQHETYRFRYPESFNRFHESDYLNKPEHQRKNLSTYDNAIVYGDSVVTRIMDLYRDEEAVVFFFPDHSIDIYDSDRSYCGHARPTDPVSATAGSEIPFVAYPTARFEARFPEKAAALRTAANIPFNTADLIYTVMDLAGIRFNSEVQGGGNSLLK